MQIQCLHAVVQSACAAAQIWILITKKYVCEGKVVELMSINPNQSPCPEIKQRNFKMLDQVCDRVVESYA